MRRLSVRLLLLAGIVALALPLTASGQEPSLTSDGATASSAQSSARYIVQLEDAPLATYDGSIAGLDATAPGAVQPGDVDDGNSANAWSDGLTPDAGGRARLDVSSPEAVAYTDYLAARQHDFRQILSSIAPTASAQYHYTVVYNGMVVRMTETEADRVARIPDVVSVTPEEPVVPLMDASLPQIGALEAWADPRIGGRADAGRGVRIAVIDSGITAAHPMFDDTGFSAPPGFPKSSLTIGDEMTPYTGDDLARYTNNKVIVARAYANPEDMQPDVTPLANMYHGAHVAGIAAGSVVTTTQSGGNSVDVSGVAPGAYLMAYKFDNAYTPEILRMIEDAVLDGADVINNSWGTAAMNVMDPELHPVSLSFKAAARAGVVVVAAAGNAGANGEATLGGPFQMIDEVITVGNVQTGRMLAQVLLAADDGLPSHLEAHPTQNFALGNTYDVIEAPALVSDLCNPIDALRARDRIVLVPHDAKCEQSLLPLPIELPDQLKFIESLITAGVVGAKGVALYAPTDQDTQMTRTAMAAAELLLGALGAQLGDISFPVTAVIGGEDAMELVTWAQAHPSVRLTISRDPVSIPAPHLVDVAAWSSARGPAPDALRMHLKPDMSAPGSSIRSANTTTDGEPNGLIAASGTSMASPHVAGAAAVVRQAWPDWSPWQIKQALLGTADPVVTFDGEMAPVAVQGSGRLNLARAVDPGLLVSPASLDFGVYHHDKKPWDDIRQSLALFDVRRSPTGPVTYDVRHEPGPGHGEVSVEMPDKVTLPTDQGGFEATFRIRTLMPGNYEGRIVFESADHTVRVAYRLEIDGPHKAVLLINNLLHAQQAGGPGGIMQPPQLVDTTDYSSYWTDALDDAGLSYDVWTIAEGEHDSVPPLLNLRHYDLVVVVAGDSNAPLELTSHGMTSLQMYLLGGGRLLASGGEWHHGPPSVMQMAGIQNDGMAYYLSRYFAGFDRTEDDVQPGADLQPVRVFAEPIRLAATASDDAAGNGGQVDVGRPLAELQTAMGGAGPGGQVQFPMDLGIASPVTVDLLMPYMRGYLELPGRGYAMTGVDADATLEHPLRADFIPWRALFGGFPVEAVTDTASTMSRSEVLARVHEWAVEPDDFHLQLHGPDAGLTGDDLAFTAHSVPHRSVEAVSWRWDAGDGRAFTSTSVPTASFTYDEIGNYTVRVEATTKAGHTYVASKLVRIGGIYLPFAISPRR